MNLVVHPSALSQQSTSFPSAGANSAAPNQSSQAVRWSEEYKYSQNQQSFYSETENKSPAQENDRVHHGSSNTRRDASTQLASYLPPISSLEASTAFEHHESKTSQQRVSGVTHAPGSFTRNLIGSLVASAFKLHDTNDKLGIWFVLQDLSVRTEGSKIFCICELYIGDR